MNSEPLDLGGTLEEVARSYWRDFAPIMLLGIALLLVPTLVLSLFLSGTPADNPVVETLSAMFSLMFISAVSAATLSGYAAPRQLSPRVYFELGVRGLQPGLIAALTIAAGLVTILIARLLLAQFTGDSAIWWMLAIAAILAALAALAPAISAAYAERLMPPSAIRRSFALTKGARVRILGIILMLFILIMPAAMVIRAVVFGFDTSPAEAQAKLASLTPAAASYWILQLFNLLVTGLIAVVPPVLYRRLVGRH